MQALDKAAIERYNIPSIELMERAGGGVAEAVARRFPKKGIVAVIAGKGNNAGDGFVAARQLAKAGYGVHIYLLSPWTEFSPDARANWERLTEVKVNVAEAFGENDLKKHAAEIEKAVCVIDAIFGTGLSSEVRGKYKNAIEFINSLLKPVAAVDIPSGLSADTGNPLGSAVRSKLTVTFGLPKVGLMTNAGREYAREVEVVDIGIPRELTDALHSGYFLITPDMFKAHFAPRREDTHKGTYGHVLVAGGSMGKMGAGLLACRGALRSGAGLVTYALPSAAFAKFDTKSPEVMFEGIADGGKGYFIKGSFQALKGALEGKDVLAIGPGMGTQDETKALFLELVKKAAVPLIIDADGLNCLAGSAGAIGGRKAPVILTPHPGELSRLTGMTVKDIQVNRIQAAKTFAVQHKCHLVLKGHRTVAVSPTGDIYINPTGNAGMATAGTGDVLTGVIASLLAQGMPVTDAVIAAVYIHGMAGDMAAEELGDRGLIASDIINNLPKAIKIISNFKSEI
jgi:NAD(P)H-hydrate epimerase